VKEKSVLRTRPEVPPFALLLMSIHDWTGTLLLAPAGVLVSRLLPTRPHPIRGFRACRHRSSP
jgi:hypothetical protein